MEKYEVFRGQWWVQGGTEDEARKVAGAGLWGRELILEVAGWHQRSLSRKRVGAAWGTGWEKEKSEAYREVHSLHMRKWKPDLSEKQGWESDPHLWAAGLLHLLLVNSQDQDAPKVRDYSPLYMPLSFVLPVFQILFSLSHEVYPGLQSWRKKQQQ